MLRFHYFAHGGALALVVVGVGVATGPSFKARRCRTDLEMGGAVFCGSCSRPDLVPRICERKVFKLKKMGGKKHCKT